MPTTGDAHVYATGSQRVEASQAGVDREAMRCNVIKFPDREDQACRQMPSTPSTGSDQLGSYAPRSRNPTASELYGDRRGK